MFDETRGRLAPFRRSCSAPVLGGANVWAPFSAENANPSPGSLVVQKMRGNLGFFIHRKWSKGDSIWFEFSEISRVEEWVQRQKRHDLISWTECSAIVAVPMSMSINHFAIKMAMWVAWPIKRQAPLDPKSRLDFWVPHLPNTQMPEGGTLWLLFVSVGIPKNWNGDDDDGFYHGGILVSNKAMSKERWFWSSKYT